MHVILSAPESELFLLEELRRGFPHAVHGTRAPGLIVSNLGLQPEAPPTLAFARQLLPDVTEHAASSVSAWALTLLESIGRRMPEGQPWLLHIEPFYKRGSAGLHRCKLIREAFRELLQQKRRQLLRSLQPETPRFTLAQSFVQLLLTAPDRGLISLAAAPAPNLLRRVMSPFPLGEVPVPSDKEAPSRAFAKLVEAEIRLGCKIARGHRCVDLGAAPGGWSYVALQRGARVVAVDHAPLRADLIKNRHLKFLKADPCSYVPESPVDWLLCDGIASPERSVSLLIDWVRHHRARRFVLTIKFKDHEDYLLLDHLKHALPPMCDEFFLTHLCANKNEACAFGIVRES